MKKLISLVLCIVMCFLSVGAGAQAVPEFMTKAYTNYTMDCTFSVSLSNAQELVDALSEIEMPEVVHNFVDVKALLESLCTSDTVVRAQADISPDYRCIKASVVASASQNIVFNRNFTSQASYKMGIWIDMDIDAQKFIAVFSTPVNEKYAVVNLAEDLPAEDANKIFDIFDKQLTKEKIEKINKEITETAVEHAEITMMKNTCTVKYDNDSFASLISDVFEYIEQMYADTEILSDGAEDARAAIGDVKDALSGVKLLGDKGITFEYTLSGDTVKSVSESWDISLSIADIYTKYNESTWDYNYSGDVNMTLISKAELSKLGTTAVDMPELTDDNSFRIVELFKNDNEADGGYVWEEPAVSYYVWGDMENEICDGERYYMPLRHCIEYAYGDSATITYDDGLVTITTNCGEADKDINAVLRVGEANATVNGVVYDGIGAFKQIDNTVYAGVDFYEKCLGWSLDYLQKNLVDGWVSYGFETREYE